MRDLPAKDPVHFRIALASFTKRSVPTAAKSAKYLSSPRRVGQSTAVTASQSTENPDFNFF